MSAKIRKIGVFTSGGDAPGMNACIRAVVRNAIHHNLTVYGIRRGYEGMIDGDFIQMDSASVGNIIHRGGTILKTSRSERFRTPEGRQQAYESLQAYEIDGVVAIGGNGTFTGGMVFSKEYNTPFIGVPGTIDNDLFGSDFTVGYDTALNTVIDAIDKIRDTADSHERLFFIEVMGRDSGFIALNAGIGGGAGAILLPEQSKDVESLIAMLGRSAKRKKLFNLVVVAEGNKEGGAMEIAKKVQERFKHFETKVTILGHLQRGGSPSCADRVLGTRLGFAAVEALLAGERNVVAGIINNQVAYTPFQEAIAKTQTLDEELFKMAQILAL